MGYIVKGSIVIPSSAVEVEDLAAYLHDRQASRSEPSIDFEETDDGALVRRSDTVKALPSKGGLTVEQVEPLARKRGIEWGPDFVFTDADGEERPRALPYTASDERVDSHGDIVKQSWKLDEYRTNPQVLFGHDGFAPSIGNSVLEEVSTVKVKGYEGPALQLIALFAGPELSAFSDQIFRLARSGLLTKGSVGFRPGRVLRIEDEKERAKLGMPPWGLIYENNRLIEFSIVTLPANGGAGVMQSEIAQARRAGTLRGDEGVAFLESLRRSCWMQGSISAFDELVDAAAFVWREEFGHGIPVDPRRLDVERSVFLAALDDGADRRAASLLAAAVKGDTAPADPTEDEPQEPNASGVPDNENRDAAQPATVGDVERLLDLHLQPYAGKIDDMAGTLSRLEEQLDSIEAALEAQRASRSAPDGEESAASYLGDLLSRGS